MNATDRWKKENTITITLRFNKKTESDYIEWIEDLKKMNKPVQTEIKKIIKKHLETY